ncbi:hypothetical protein HAX54_006070, partial [Datura stramonium]|nr:hypothetical protein [Datura stramonium]
MCTAGKSPVQHRLPEALGAQDMIHRRTADPVRKPPVNSCEMFGTDLGTMKFGDSPIGSGETSMKRSGGPRIPPVTHRCFADAADSLND